ncbi:glycosyltransferase family 88 protein [Legionella pneumophila serogroup 1]|uniref:glycosyltransferase family 88 protein n=1 Tax=Legionella pneumophila TaxID=446 RepID=UPI001A2F2DFC|nr:glycosyltransferase family 88 protein [Legionella pneumophila]HAT8830117.1 glucosyltransferase Lgt1 [Legionella pneumophila subsp. pneumophila]BCZ96975.1 glucosyltransferase Lgt1 [Legionella pneumophila]HAT2058222.1 glucosyltransferase Lgt1 [Legionella pneumophila]HAU0854415.1 glucosyltransferase Lgt1 [Legionella pneumophila]HAU0888999.1 glucosyltransferase Lgt1 [Legionella pneumophila]
MKARRSNELSKLRMRFFSALNHTSEIDLHILFDNLKSNLTLGSIEHLQEGSVTYAIIQELLKGEDAQKKIESFLKGAIKNVIHPGVIKGLTPDEINWNVAKAYPEYYEHEKLPDVTFGGFKVRDSNEFKFKTNVQTSIWFSIKPELFMPSKQQEALKRRREQYPGCEIRLIYSSSLLNPEANRQMKAFARKQNITLIDIDTVKTDSPLYPLLKAELANLGKGGNPAAASDLCRWIPELFNEGFYVDIDLPVDSSKIVEGHQITGGVPIMLNMGSIISEPIAPHHRRQEAVCMNTDIIAYSNDKRTQKMMNTVALHLKNIYDDPYTALKDTPLAQTAFFNRCKVEGKNIFELRKGLQDAFRSDSLLELYDFLGATKFKEVFKLKETQIKYIDDHISEFNEYDLLLHLISDNPSEINQHTLDFGRAKVMYMDIAKEHYSAFYKPLVEEISGPGAIYNALGGASNFTTTHRRSTGPMLPTTPPRVLQVFCDAHDKGPFVSDNIARWQTNVRELGVLNREGLSWLPSVG